jgi:histidine triad (HIT) family protein
VSCLFCAILAGDHDAHFVFNDPLIAGFLDSRPVFKGHTLLVPRTHIDTITELPPELYAPLLDAAARVTAAMRSALNAQGSFVAINNTVSQSVPHLHLHVVPRTKGDGLRGFFWPRTKYDDETEAARYASRLGDAMDPHRAHPSR